MEGKEATNWSDKSHAIFRGKADSINIDFFTLQSSKWSNQDIDLALVPILFHFTRTFHWLYTNWFKWIRKANTVENQWIDWLLCCKLSGFFLFFNAKRMSSNNFVHIFDKQKSPLNVSSYSKSSNELLVFQMCNPTQLPCSQLRFDIYQMYHVTTHPYFPLTFFICFFVYPIKTNIDTDTIKVTKIYKTLNNVAISLARICVQRPQIFELKF